MTASEITAEVSRSRSDSPGKPSAYRSCPGLTLVGALLGVCGLGTTLSLGPVPHRGGETLALMIVRDLQRVNGVGLASHPFQPSHLTIIGMMRLDDVPAALEPGLNVL